MATRATPTDILRMRLHSQRIASPVGGIAETVRHLLAVQAQDFAQALWAVGLRSAGSTRTGVLAALASGEVVRTLPMRGTLHLVPAEDLRWMLTLTGERSLASAATRFRDLGLDTQTLERSAEIAINALAGGKQLGRAEFVALLEQNGISCEGQRGYHIIFFLTQRRIVCWGPPSGTQQALVLVDEWIPKQDAPDRDHALKEFALRYFTGHGPATVRDFAWWAKLKLADARAAILAAGSQLTELSCNDNSFWIATHEAQLAPTSKGLSGVYALPGFDEYLLGYQDRTMPLAPEHSQRIVPGNNGIFLPLIVSRGRVVGTWRRTPRSKASTIEAEHFSEATTAERTGFERASRRYQVFAQH
ncbi:MAG: hypothetical protein QOF79_2698 [Actinomycetota bacterium]|nr:hypothetical protein [Actinomycetota bacterium]